MACLRWRFGRRLVLTAILLVVTSTSAGCVVGTSRLGPVPPVSVPTLEGKAIQGRLKDIQWLAAELPRRHKNLFFSLSTADYGKALDDLARRAGGLSDWRFAVTLAQIVAKVGDAHTSVRVGPPSPGFGRLPVDFYAFSDGLWVTRAGRDFPQLLGTRLVRIGDTPADKALELAATVVSHENEAWLRARAPVYLSIPEVLEGLGIVPDGKRVEMEFSKDGATFTITLDRQEYNAIQWEDAAYPAWWGKEAVLSYSYLAAEKAFYIKYTSCSGDLSKDIDTIRRLLDEKHPTRIVFDMRRNTGGNSQVAQGLIKMLASRPEVKEPGRLFVLVGRETFSSAILNSYDFKERTSALFFGEPTGGKPNGYGEVKSAQLPYSGLTVGYSVKYFKMVEGDPPSLLPDQQIPLTAQDFFAGRDPVLDAALAFKPR